MNALSEGMGESILSLTEYLTGMVPSKKGWPPGEG